jgi:hypothetical protein
MRGETAVMGNQVKAKNGTRIERMLLTPDKGRFILVQTNICFAILLDLM